MPARNIATILILLIMAPLAHAADPIYTGFFSNVAVGGYDPIAYFTEGEAVEGDQAHALEYMGAEFRFNSESNLAMFRADPEKYAPQYGGYCAWAMATGDFAKGDPHYWAIVDGKLYLNYDRKIQEKWQKDIPGFIESADARWPGVLD